MESSMCVGAARAGDAANLVLGNYKLFRRVCSYLRLKDFKALRYACRSFAHRSFDFMLDHFLFHVTNHEQSRGGRITSFQDLSKMPRRVQLFHAKKGSAFPETDQEWDSIKELEFKYRVDQDALDRLPKYLESLSLVTVLTRPLTNLPNTLTCLNITNDSGYFPLWEMPPALTTLSLCGFDLSDRLHLLPRGLKNFKTMVCRNDDGWQDLPPGLETIRIQAIAYHPVFRLPEGIRDVELEGEFDLPVDDLPSSITTLSLGYRFNRPVDRLPDGLVELHLGWSFDQPLNRLPASLRALYLSREQAYDLSGLPQGLEILYLRTYNHPLGKLPEGLKVLYVGGSFDHPIDDIPDSIKILYLGDEFDQPVKRLPSSLLYARFGHSFKQSLQGMIPESLKILHLYFWAYEAMLPGSVYDHLCELAVTRTYPHLIKDRCQCLFGPSKDPRIPNFYTLNKIHPTRSLTALAKREFNVSYYVKFFKKINLY